MSHRAPYEYYLARRKARSILSLARLVAGVVSGAASAALQPPLCHLLFAALLLASYLSTWLLASKLRLSSRERWTTGLIQLFAGGFIGLVLGSA